MFSFELLLDAIVLGVLLGCFYAAVSIGLSVSFGLLDVPHVAHPALPRARARTAPTCSISLASTRSSPGCC